MCSGSARAAGSPTEGLKLTQKMEWDTVTHKLTHLRMDIHLPPDFPEKYKEAVIRAPTSAPSADLLDPPQFDIRTV